MRNKIRLLGIYLSMAVVFITVLTYPVLAQETAGIIKLGDSYFDNQNYFRASNYYLKALEKEPNNINAKYKLAESYRFITNYQTAENFYGEVLRRSESLFPLARYYYALTQKFNGKYRESLNNFELFIKNVENNQYTRLRGAAVITYSEQARIELEGCLMALDELDQTQFNHNFHLLGEPVNTSFNDYAAYTYHHDSTIVITSARQESKGSHFDNRFGESLTDLFRFQFIDGTWAPVTPTDRFDREINTRFHDGSGVFNRDFTKFYFTHCAQDEDCEIYFSRMGNDGWTRPVPLNKNVNRRESDSMHPALTATGDTLFFASNRPGGLGDFDIWMSIAKAENSWGPAVNLGDFINTSFKEISPFYDYKGNTLFFASDGHIGHGGLDIMMAEEIFDQSTPVFNMGLPFNSSSDDAFFTLGEIGGYLSSNREGGLGNMDIYSFQMDSDSEIISEVISSKQEASRNSIFVTDYTFDNPDLEMIEGVVSTLLASRLHNTNLPFSAKEQEFYDSLSESDKIRIERIINSRMMSTQLVNLETVRHEDEFFYQQIAGDFKYYVDRMVTYYLEDYEISTIAIIPEDDRQFYEDLNSNSKGSIDRYIALKLNEFESIDLDDAFYSSRPEIDKNKIDNISQDYLKSKTNLSSVLQDDDNLNYLSAMDDDDRTRTELAIANQVGMVSSQKDFELKDEDKDFFDKLDTEGKTSLDNIALAYIQASVDNLEDHLNPNDLAYFNNLKENEKAAFDKLLAKRIQNYLKADVYALDAMKSSDLQDIISLQQQENLDIDQFLSDPSVQNNSVLKSMASDDKNRFSRLLASAASMVMMESGSEIKSVALNYEREQQLRKILADLNEQNPANETLFAGYNSRNSREQALIEKLMVKHLNEITDTDSLTMLSRDSLISSVERSLTGDLSFLSSSEQQLVSRMSDEEIRELATVVADLGRSVNDQNANDFNGLRNIQNLSPATLKSLKFDPTAPAITYEERPPIEEETPEPENLTPTPPTRPTSLSQQNLARISAMVSGIKRKFSSALTPKEKKYYSSLTPAEKRFHDEALKAEIQKYVLNNDSILIRSNEVANGSLRTDLNEKIDLNAMARHPKTRRYFAAIRNKPQDQKSAMSELIVSSAQILLNDNRNELIEMADWDPVAAVTPKKADSNEPTTPVAIPKLPAPNATPEIVEMVVSTKPNLIKNLSSDELQFYMNLDQLDKQFIDNTISEKLQEYKDTEDPILLYSKMNTEASGKRLNQLLTADLSPPALSQRTEIYDERMTGKTDEHKDQFSHLMIKMLGAIMAGNATNLTDNTPDQSTSSTISFSAILDGMAPQESEIYEQMSPQERVLFEKVTTNNTKTGNISLTNGSQTGQVITVEIVNSDEKIDLDNMEGQLRLIGPNKFKAGEKLKLVWSEAQQTWYEITRTQN